MDCTNRRSHLAVGSMLTLLVTIVMREQQGSKTAETLFASSPAANWVKRRFALLSVRLMKREEKNVEQLGLLINAQRSLSHMWRVERNSINNNAMTTNTAHFEKSLRI